KPDRLAADVTFPATTPAGVYQLTLKSPAGESMPVPFSLDPFPALAEIEPNDSPGTGQKITLPASVIGAVAKAGDVDYFRFEAIAGQQVGVQVIKPTGSKFDPYLVLMDAEGKTVAESGAGFLGYACPKAGSYSVGIRDKEYNGAADFTYRLH